jgi:hypothetical protein
VAVELATRRGLGPDRMIERIRLAVTRQVFRAVLFRVAALPDALLINVTLVGPLLVLSGFLRHLDVGIEYKLDSVRA